MPRYEEVLESMKNLSEDEIKAKVEEAKKICADYCGKCPSYTGTGETKLVFCSPMVGKSEIIKEEKGCLCGSCPVQQSMGLRWGYYCTRGSAKEQLDAEKSS